MTKAFVFKGYCPEQNNEVSLSIDYLDASTLNEKKFIRGLAKCEYASLHNCSQMNNCPIINSAPEKL